MRNDGLKSSRSLSGVEVGGWLRLRSATDIRLRSASGKRIVNSTVLTVDGEEVDACRHLMELLSETKPVQAEKLQPLMAKANERMVITISSIKTARDNKK